MKNLIFLDTETTGNTENDVLCQLAFKTGNEIFSELYKPAIPIPPEASAVTHITNKMVADKPAFKESPDYSRVKSLIEDPESVVIAHNAKFDVGMLAKEGIDAKRAICTLRLIRFLDVEEKIPKYNLQFLRYFYELEVDAQAHDAKGDILVLEALWERILPELKVLTQKDGDEFLEEAREISSRPSLIRTFSFGKYVGQKVAEIAKADPGYLDWLLGQKLNSPTDEEDWIYTLKHYLGK